MAKRLMEARPWLVRQENEDKRTPMNLAAHKNQIEVLRVLLQHDPSLGYFISTDGSPLLCIAATEGHVGVARELLRHCPDPPYCDATGSICLHIAVSSGQGNFVRYVLRSPQFQHLINLPNDRGETALRLAGRMLPAGDEQKTQTMMSIFDVLLCYRRDLLAEPFTSVCMVSPCLLSQLLTLVYQPVLLLHGLILKRHQLTKILIFTYFFLFSNVRN